MKYLYIVTILTFSLSAEIKYQTPTIPADQGKLYNEIVDLRSKNPQQALKKFSELPQNYSPAFDFLQAVIFIDLKMEKRAVTFLQKSLEKLPTFYQARLTLAQLLLKASNYKDALPQLIEVVKLGRADGSIWKNISICHLELNKYDSAILALNQARIFTPDDQSLDQALLNIYIRQQNYLKSEELVKQMIDRHKDNSNYWTILVQSLLANKKMKEALLNQELKIRLFGPENSDIKTLADLYYNEGVFLKAAELYLKVEGELSGKSLVQAARCYSYNGDHDKVISILNKPEKLSPSEKEKFYTLRADAQLKKMNKKEALADFLEALKFNSNNSFAQYYIAEIYEELDKPDLALDFYNRASKNSTYFVSAKLRKARIYLNSNNNEMALAEVEAVKKVDDSESTEEFYKYLKAKVFANK